MFNFIKLSNSLFIPTKEEKSLLQQIDNSKLILVMCYLYINTNRKDIVKFTLEDMILESGYTVSTKKNRSVEQFKYILVQLQKLKLINSKYDFNEVKPKELISCTVLMNLENKFIQLFEEEKDIILNQKNEKVDNSKLLVFYCYIKSRIYRREKNLSIVATGGRAEVCYPSYETISNDLGCTDETIKKYSDILVKLNLIRIDNPGFWYYSADKNKSIKESVNFYALLFDSSEENAKLNLKEGIKYYKTLDINSNKVFTDSREYLHNNRKLNGMLGSIIKKEKNGIATEEDINLKNEIIFTKSQEFEDSYKIKALLEIHADELLSNIYFDLAKYDIGEKYYRLELDLGLIDEDSDLLVSYEYYTWVMTNYTKDKHDYYKNCIAKHIKDEDKPKPKGLQYGFAKAEELKDRDKGVIWGSNYNYSLQEIDELIQGNELDF